MFSLHKNLKLGIENGYLLSYHTVFLDKTIYLNNAYIKVRILGKCIRIYNILK